MEKNQENAAEENSTERRIKNDDVPFDPSPWLDYPKVVMFGCNHYGNKLPTGTTLIWIKRNDPAFGTFLSDAELAWMKGGCGVYCFNRVFNGSSRAVDAGINAYEPALHPSQKPVSLMAWCMEQAGVAQGRVIPCKFGPSDTWRNATVLDPYTGSGTTAIACIRTARDFIGIEIDEGYFNIAVERCKREIDGQLL